MSLHLLGLSPTLWGDELAKDFKGKFNANNSVSDWTYVYICVFCAAHLWQLDQLAHHDIMCAQINVMSPSNKCWQCETMHWETQAGRLESLHGSKMELKTAAGCRPALARALVGAKAAWSQGSSNSVLRPAQKCQNMLKIANTAQNQILTCKIRPTMLYMTSIWLALTGTICINTPWCFFLKILNAWNILEVQGSRGNVEALASGVCLFSFWRTDSTSGARRLSFHG